MCGFVGLIGNINADIEEDVRQMASALSHRGPDSEGFWRDSESEIILCHRRLSVMDLSESGMQPMISASERYVICFNGEIYNHQELRAQLSGAGHLVNWRGNSDTESLLEMIDVYGCKKAIE